MKTKLFVGNLSFDASSEELKVLFEKYGPVEEATVVVDKRSGKSKGYGFVQMVESKDAAMALELSGHDFKGREIVVTEADSPGEGQRRRTTRQGGGREGGRDGGRDRGRDRGNRSGTEGWRDNGVETFIPKKKPSLWSRLFGWLKPEPKKKTVVIEPREHHSSRSGGGDRDRHRQHRRRQGGGRSRHWNNNRRPRNPRPHDQARGDAPPAAPQQSQQG